MNMLSANDLNKIKNIIAKKFNPQLVYMFGSYAVSKQNKTSDLDLLIIDEKAEKQDLSWQISLELFPRNYHLDILTYTPATFEQKIKTNPFIKKIIQEGKLLYERS